MKLHLTEAQLLHEWQLRYLPPQVNAGVTVNSGYDLDAIMKARMRDWYSRLLAAGDPAMLAPVDISDRLKPVVNPDGSMTVMLPDNVIRVVAVDMEGWKSPALITRDPASRTARRQRSPYSRGTADSPVAVIDGRRMTVHTAAAGDNRLTVTAIADDPDMYHLDSAALSTIKSFYFETTP